MTPERLAFLLAGVVAASVLLLGMGRVARTVRRRAASRRAQRRSNRAVEGERAAEALLSAHGYRILDRQPRLTWTVECGDDRHTVDLRADLLVERDQRRYVAEVKTGATAPQLGNAATRRQLLEYRVAYDVDAALLVDMEEARITEVVFSMPERWRTKPRRSRAAWKVAMASALAAAAASASLTRWLLQ